VRTQGNLGAGALFAVVAVILYLFYLRVNNDILISILVEDNETTGRLTILSGILFVSTIIVATLAALNIHGSGILDPSVVLTEAKQAKPIVASSNDSHKGDSRVVFVGEFSIEPSHDTGGEFKLYFKCPACGVGPNKDYYCPECGSSKTREIRR